MAQEDDNHRCRACAVPISARSKFCSDRCRCWSRLHPGELRPKGRQCSHCGTSIDDLASHARFCSGRCEARSRRGYVPGTLDRRLCGICNVWFRPRRRDQLGCCAEHGAKLSSRRTESARRAQRNAAATTFTESDLALRLSMFPGCWVCGGPKDQVDHVKPLAAGGAHLLANLRPICAPCNRRKSAQWPWPLVAA